MDETLRAQEDFDAARFRAFRMAILGTLTRRGRGLASMDAALEAAGSEGRSFAGVQEIPLDRVVGSAASDSKSADFDPGFLPVNRRMRDRWTRIYRAMVEGEELPPIDVYKLGANYYVIDGHHRVSVARSLGRPTVNARVIEVKTRAPLGPEVDAPTLLRAAEYRQFLETTRLHELRPQARLEVSRLGRYDEILKHILGHRYFLSLERGHEVTLAEAAAGWYDNVYLPVAREIREHGVLEHFPGWTEADLYVEITRRWLELSEAGQPAGAENATHSLLAEDARKWWKRRRSLRVQSE
ncbi:MAG: ParB N-terminal domain-containing protein [Candidatus Dormibacteraeota bacterium]|nr:ParB N-terminal domain-containing protein [Candidatus Dormibacteraeota bacterium]